MPSFKIRFTEPCERAYLRSENQGFFSTKINSKSYNITLDAFTIIGYIPIASVVTGVFRMIIGSVSTIFYPDWGSKQILRAAFETMSLGWLYIPIDAGWIKIERS